MKKRKKKKEKKREKGERLLGEKRGEREEK